VVGILHCDGLGFKVEFRCKRSDLFGVVIRHQNIALGFGEQPEKISMINLPVSIEPAGGDRIRRINEEGGAFIICVTPDHFESVGFHEGEALSDAGDLLDAPC